MTVKLGDAGSGEEGLKKLGKRSADEESLEGEGAGGADVAEDGSGTKREEPTSRADGASAPPGGPQASSPPQGSPQDQHHFLRSSVRPQSKRPRKDSPCVVGSAGPSSSGPRGKGTDSGGTSSGNVSGVASAGGSRSSSRNIGSSGAEKEEGKKVRRQWESWSTEDKNTFFEGLYEHGKDFEAIQNNIALKYKKKGKPASMVKNKEQVRHFYYRTWHKITKYIDFDNVFSRGLKKSSQELYGLICYGELRKKIGGCMDDKNATKLNELIQVGATTVRYKGRNLRIKAPMCRALKKLCDPDGLSDEEDQKPVRLPLKVPVELQPRNNHAWARVQSLAQNPRLRMIVELHRKVSSLIEFLKQKWALHEVRIRKTLEEGQLQGMNPAQMQEKVTLHLFPGENCTLTPLPGVARVVHSKAFCTVHWQEGGRCKQSAKDTHSLPPAQILGIQSGQGTARGQVKCPRGSTEGKGGGRPPPTTDTSQSSGESSPESAPGEGATPSLSSPDAPDRPSPGHQDSLLHLEKIPAAPPTEGGDGPAREPGSLLCACGQLSDLEDELSLLDPLPRYLKSCQDLIIPEQCRCADARPRSEQPSLGRATSPETLASSGKEAANLVASGPDPQCGPGPRLLLDVCTKEPADTPSEEPQEKGSPLEPLPPQGQSTSRPPKEIPASRLAQQLREEGWSLQTSESLTLAEVYLMMGKPSKLQLEYDWLAVLGPEGQSPGGQGQAPRPGSPPTTLHEQRLLSCLLKLISTEVNPKLTPEANASVRPAQEEQSATPPGKVVTISSRSPRCPRNQSALRSSKTFPSSSTSCSPGLRNPPRPLLVAGPSSTGSSDSDGGLFAVPTTLPPNSRHGKLFSPSKEAELTFRQHLNSISMQSDFFLPKPRKLRNRHLRKPLVVQRTLLPRPSENQSHNVCSFSILSNSPIAGRGSFRPIQSSLTKAALSRPIVPKVLPSQATSHLASAIDLAAQSAGIIPGSPLPVLETEGLSGISPLSSDEVTGTISGQDCTGPHQNGDPVPTVGGTSNPFIGVPPGPEQEPVVDSFQQGSSVLSLSELPKTPLQNGLCTPLTSSEGSSTRLSPPNVSALLDISLPGPPEDVLSQGEPATQISDSIIEIAISSGQFGEGVPLSPAKLNGSDSSKSLPSPSSSPQPNWIASPTHDPQWYPSDSTDSSLSSLFASFISPEKSRKMLPTPIGSNSGTSLLGPSLLDGNSRDSFVSRSLADVAEVVDSQLACMMNENSIDYISRFNDLAQELSITEPGRREAIFDSGGGGPSVGDLSQ
ncbi:protein cramped-like isoform X1 [Fukomys damarensis]|uniref:protein cramped-like isoform X1 n=1 Tax=Fukomys damarensis TaxID=885580 RepID=UPI00053F7032|nr:protein cramped-like isoform X1 [Fukomys damarensis]XP_010618802.1 protein cramped-like isoform X1 [Fukomys damarensis]XP_010618803.1 protein cramped-like isoform X1 [Fukomys damarensis]